ncbi:unnamed protein product, partial [Rotaria magnacalcarata]
QQLVDAVNSPYDSKIAAEIFHVPASTIRRHRALQWATEYCQSLGLSYRPGVKWLRLFMNQHANDTKWQRQGKME